MKNASPAVNKGEASYDGSDPKFHNFIGSFSEGSAQGFTGYYDTSPGSIMNPRVATPLFLFSKENQDCPDGDRAKVTYAYFGFNNSDNDFVAGMAIPDTIYVNSYSAGTKILADLTAKLKELLLLDAKINTLDLALKAAQIALAKFTAKNGLDAAIKELDARKLKLKTTQDKITALNTEIADLNNKIKEINDLIKPPDKKPKPNKDELKALKAKLKGYEKSLAEKQEELNKLTKLWVLEGDIIKQEQKVLDIENKNKATSDALKAEIAAAQKSYDDAVAALAIAKPEIVSLGKEIEKQKAINLAWDKWRADTLIHEEGHRQICYLYVEKMTKLANNFRAFGYAHPAGDSPEALAAALARAKEIGEIHYIKRSLELINDIRRAENEHQDRYDNKTNHGANQNLWTPADMQVVI